MADPMDIVKAAYKAVKAKKKFAKLRNSPRWRLAQEAAITKRPLNSQSKLRVATKI